MCGGFKPFSEERIEKRNIKKDEALRFKSSYYSFAFADDSLFFFHANKKSCTDIKAIINAYEKASGQAVNYRKSTITFGARVKSEVKTHMRRLMNINNEGGNGKYLGLLEQFGRKKKEMFGYTVDKVKEKTKG